MKEQTMEHDFRDVLLKSASIVEQGWCQGFGHIWADGTVSRVVNLDTESEPAQSCASGAIQRSSRVLGASGETVDDAYDHLRDAIGGGYIPEWNDAPGRTKEEVAEAMREAAGC